MEEARVEPIAIVVRRRRLEWFGHVKIRDEVENIRAVAEIKMEGKRPRGRPGLRWKGHCKRDMKACKMREKWKDVCRTCYLAQGDSGEG